MSHDVILVLLFSLTFDLALGQFARAAVTVGMSQSEAVVLGPCAPDRSLFLRRERVERGDSIYRDANSVPAEVKITVLDYLHSALTRRCK